MENTYAILAAIIAVAVFAVLLLSGGRPTLSNQTASGKITITATGIAYGLPGQADMYITINGTGRTNSEAVANLSNTVSRFNSTIYPYVNGNLSRVSTSYINVMKEYTYNDTRNTTYLATESITVIIPNQANASAAIGSLSDIPNIYVQYVNAQFSGSQATSLRQQALSAAVSNASSQASAVLGPGTRIAASNITVENYYPYPIVLPLTRNSAGAATGVSSPQFYNGRSYVSATVTVVYSYYGAMTGNGTV